MNPLTKFRNLFAKAPVTTSIDVVSAWQANKPLPSPFDVKTFSEDGYRRNVIIFGCVTEIATSISEPPLLAFQVDGDGNKIPLTKDHPLSVLLGRKGKQQSAQDFFQRLSTHLDVAGNVYIYKVRNNRREIVDLKLLRPDRVTPIPNVFGDIVSYQYSLEGFSKQTIDISDIVQIQCHIDVLNEFQGLSPIAVLARVGDLDNQSVDFLRAFFLNGGTPPGLLKFKLGGIGSDERQRVREMWQEQYSGPKGWHSIGVVDADVDYQKTGSDVKEMDLSAIFGQTETRICSAYGVPPILIGCWIGLKSSTYANYREARKSFWQETLVPRFFKISSSLTSGVAYEFGENIILEYDLSKVDAIQEERAEIRKFALESWGQGLLTRNEARSLAGWDPDDSGNVYKTTYSDVLTEAGEDVVPESETQSFYTKKDLHEEMSSPRKLRVVAEQSVPGLKKKFSNQRS